MKTEIESKSVEQTYQFAKEFAKSLKGGEVIELIGDVGAGKTTFVSGLAKALDCKEDVSSPTFKICNTYHGRYTVHHCDFYRLGGDELIRREIDEMIDNNSILVLEWSEMLGSPVKNSIKVYFSYAGETQRKISLKLGSKQ